MLKIRMQWELPGSILPILASFTVHGILLSCFAFSNFSSRIITMPLGMNSSSKSVVAIVAFQNSSKPSPRSFARTVPDFSRPVLAQTGLPTPGLKTLKNLAVVSTKSQTSGETGKAGLLSSNAASNPGPLGEYLFGLRRLIDEKKVYPSVSRRMGETGKVLLTLELLRDGRIQEIKLKNKSEFARLDQAAIQALASVEKYKPIPEIVSGDRLIVEVPVEFSL